MKLYPAAELSELAEVQARLSARIARRRLRLATDASRILEPVKTVDHYYQTYRKFAPVAKLAALPIGFLATRFLTKRLGLFGKLVKWAPFAFGAYQQLHRADLSEIKEKAAEIVDRFKNGKRGPIYY